MKTDCHGLSAVLSDSVLSVDKQHGTGRTEGAVEANEDLSLSYLKKLYLWEYKQRFRFSGA